MFNILIAEDDKDLSQLFEHVLVKNHFNVKCVEDGQQALDELGNEYYDLLISDLMMPVMDGYELTKSIRSSGMQLPILIVTAKDQFEDLRVGFDIGADDYMVKPVNIDEMVLRVNALLRRAGMNYGHRQTVGNTAMDYETMTVESDGKSITLPQKEFLLLYKMFSFPGRIFTRQQLKDEIWGYDSNSDMHTVEVHIGRLRERFKENKDFKIVTIHGIGYKVVQK